MTLQYIANETGQTTAVQLQIPIEDWRVISGKYPELTQIDSPDDFEIPQWQKDLLDKELAQIEAGTADFMPWEEFRKELGV